MDLMSLLPIQLAVYFTQKQRMFTQKVRTIEFNHYTFVENITFDFVEKSERKECSASIAISKLYMVAYQELRRIYYLNSKMI